MTSRDRFAELASDLDIDGRSSMNKAELEAAVLDRLDSTDLSVCLRDYKVDLSDDIAPALGVDAATGEPVDAPEPVEDEKLEELAASVETVDVDENAEAEDEA